ncbi:hypothetical protein F383_03678 [Gossypium arboreum]|uniref:Uncharacterized protein n=1 Tax=Gossypium arboreum TaxID=29729 RepID=A0A0B0NPM3_GOSAR|nr:hypothetical protein F383_03678 [Gossypium arboreum]
MGMSILRSVDKLESDLLKTSSFTLNLSSNRSKALFKDMVAILFSEATTRTSDVSGHSLVSKVY